MTCPGSYRVASAVTEPATPSRYAAAGSVAHAIAEDLLINGGPIDSKLGQTIPMDGHNVLVDEDMIESIEVYLNAIAPVRAKADVWLAEQSVDLGIYWNGAKPPVPLFGTCDFFAYTRLGRRLTIADYKHGAGHYVPHIDNAQMLYYAAGGLALLDIVEPLGDFSEECHDVEMIIVQPRVPGREPVRSYVLPVVDILAWVHSELMPAVASTQQPDAKLVMGDHCKWCPGTVICPAMQDVKLKAAQRAFGVVPENVVDATEGEIATYLDDAEKLEIWIDATRDEAKRRIEDGKRIPGWALQATRPKRVWTDEDSVVGRLLDAGYHTEDIYEASLLTPAAMKKLISPNDWNDVASLVEARSSGMKLARQTKQTTPFDKVDES